MSIGNAGSDSALRKGGTAFESDPGLRLRAQADSVAENDRNKSGFRNDGY